MTVWAVASHHDPRSRGTEPLVEYEIAFDTDVELHQWADAFLRLFEASLQPDELARHLAFPDSLVQSSFTAASQGRNFPSNLL